MISEAAPQKHNQRSPNCKDAVYPSFHARTKRGKVQHLLVYTVTYK